MSRLFKETTFIFFSCYKVFTSNNIFNISFAQDKAPLQAMDENSESTDDNGKWNTVVSYQERIALEIFIVRFSVKKYLTSWPLRFCT